MQKPESENAADVAENVGISIGEYASLCTNQIPCNLLAAKRYPAVFQIAQVALPYRKSYFFAALKQYSESCVMLPKSTTCFKSNEEEQSWQNVCIWQCFLYTGIGLIFHAGQYASLGIRIGIRKEKNEIKTSVHKLLKCLPTIMS